MNQSYFNKEMSLKIKGMAIIFMFVHHVLTFEKNWPEGYSASKTLVWFANHFQSPTRICVSVFAFLTGYYYFFEKKTIQNSLKRIQKLIISYWFVFCIFLLIYCLSMTPLPSIPELLMELLGLKSKIAVFNWYVVFILLLC